MERLPGFNLPSRAFQGQTQLPMGLGRFWFHLQGAIEIGDSLPSLPLLPEGLSHVTERIKITRSEPHRFRKMRQGLGGLSLLAESGPEVILADLVLGINR